MQEAEMHLDSMVLRSCYELITDGNQGLSSLLTPKIMSVWFHDGTTPTLISSGTKLKQYGVIVYQQCYFATELK